MNDIPTAALLQAVNTRLANSEQKFSDMIKAGSSFATTGKSAIGFVQAEGQKLCKELLRCLGYTSAGGALVAASLEKLGQQDAGRISAAQAAAILKKVAKSSKGSPTWCCSHHLSCFYVKARIVMQVKAHQERKEKKAAAARRTKRT